MQLARSSAPTLGRATTRTAPTAAALAPASRLAAVAAAAAPSLRRRGASSAAADHEPAAAAPSRRRRGRGLLVVSSATGDKASPPPRKNNNNDDDGGKGKKTEEYVEGLKKAGVDAAVASKILARWSDATGGSGQGGADEDPSTLRRLFLKQSLTPLLAVSAQVLIDTLSAYFAFSSAALIDLSGPPGLGRSFAVGAATLLSGYFAAGALIDVVTLGALLYALVKLGACPEALLAAVKSIAAGSGTAGAATGLQIADKAAAAINAVKVAAALDAIAGMVAGSGAPGAAGGGTLRSLTAFLTLQRAEKKEGFDPAALGLTESQALAYALAFGGLDRNEDGYVSPAELGEVTRSLGLELSGEEAGAALAAMDADGDGRVTFGEFAAWFCKQGGERGAVSKA